MNTITFYGELDQLEDAAVQATCTLAAPLNTVLHPTDICIDRIIMRRPLWLEFTSMAANVKNLTSPANAMICRMNSNLSLVPAQTYLLLGDQLKEVYGT